MKKQWLLAAVLVTPVLSFGASLQSMSQADVKQALEDKTITTIPLTMLNQEMVAQPANVYFGQDGQVSGRFETAPSNNAAQSDQGTWTVKEDGQACVTWQHWNNAQQTCVYFYDTKNSLVVVDTNNMLNTVILKDKITSGNQVQTGGAADTSEQSSTNDTSADSDLSNSNSSAQ